MIELPSHATRAPTDKRRILVVDDDAQVARALQRVLEMTYLVTTARDGAEALAKIVAGERFDAILTDLMMPRLTGMALHERLLTVAPEQAAKVIFVTATSFERGAREFLGAFEGRWLDKPFDRQELLDLVHRVASG